MTTTKVFERQEKTNLECIIEWNPVQEEIAKGFNHGKEAKDDPVNEPLLIITLHFGFNGVKRLEGRIDKTRNAAETSGTNSEKDNDGQESTDYQDEIFLWNLGCILKWKWIMWKRGEIYGEEGARQENSRHSFSCMSGRRDAVQVYYEWCVLGSNFHNARYTIVYYILNMI